MTEPQPKDNDQQSDVAPTGGSKPLGWQIATLVLAIATAGFAIWGFNATRELSDEQAAADQKISELEQKLSQAEQQSDLRESAQQQLIDSLRGKAEQFKSELNIDTDKIEEESAEVKDLEKQYDDAQAEAKKDNDDLEAQLRASQAEVALAKKCATVMATGLMKLYEASPTEAIFEQIDQMLSDTSAACSKVIDV